MLTRLQYNGGQTNQQTGRFSVQLVKLANSVWILKHWFQSFVIVHPKITI